MTTLPLPSLIRASAHDAAAQSAREAGRPAWSEDDYDLACSTFNRLVDACYGTGPEGRIKFQIAESLQRNGYLTIDMTAEKFFDTIEAVYDAK